MGPEHESAGGWLVVPPSGAWPAEAATTNRAGQRALVILAFHKVGEPSPGAWETWYYTTVPEFLGYLSHLREHGWQVIDAATLVRGLCDPAALPPRAALLTFDDGYRSVLEVATPVLRRFGYPAVVFVPTAYVGRGSHSFDADSAEPNEPLCDWDELAELERLGVSVQSHGTTHRAFSRLDAAQRHEELRGSKAVLEARLGKPVELFSFPYGDGGADPREVSQALARTGYTAACLYDGLINPAPPSDPYRLSRLTLGRWGDPQTVLASLLRGGAGRPG
jgi:peptidoglycan/xylan/chitin deacetylase (PgdA/CDA1 family)